jgi:sugar phosphate isomerase/epimerase
MKIGVSSYSFQGLISEGKETQLSIIKTAKEMGFDGIEFTDLNAPEGMSEKDYAREIREECEKYSLPVISYTIGADMLRG